MSAVRGRQTTEQEPAQLQEVRVAVKGELQLLQPRIGVIPMLGLLYESLYWARQTAPGPGWPDAKRPAMAQAGCRVRSFESQPPDELLQLLVRLKVGDLGAAPQNAMDEVGEPPG
jgi:hypothetical protein